MIRTNSRPEALGPGDPSEAPWISRIESVGIELPQRRVTTAEVMAACRRGVGIDLEKLTGIRERRVCSDGESSCSLAIDAARDCLARSNHRAEDLEMIISCSISKYDGGLSYRFEPPLSLSIKEAIEAPRALHFDIANACAGMFTGLYLLDNFIRRGVVRRGMVVSGEYITSLSDNAVSEVGTLDNPQLASLTLGDSGAAVVLERAEKDAAGIHSLVLSTLAEHDQLCIGKACPNRPGAMMETKAGDLHRVAIASAPRTIEHALKQAGVRFDEIDHAIPHQTSVRAIRAGTEAYQKRLGGVPKHVVYNLEELGNTSSTTHFLALHRCLEEGQIKPGERVLFLIFASGVVVGAAVATLDDMVGRYGRAD